MNERLKNLVRMHLDSLGKNAPAQLCAAADVSATTLTTVLRGELPSAELVYRIVRACSGSRSLAIELAGEVCAIKAKDAV